MKKDTLTEMKKKREENEKKKYLIVNLLELIPIENEYVEFGEIYNYINKSTKKLTKKSTKKSLKNY